MVSNTQIAINYISFCAGISSPDDFLASLNQKIQFNHQVNSHQHYSSNDRDGIAKLFKKYIFKNVKEIHLIDTRFEIKHNKIKIRLKFQEIIKKSLKESTQTAIYHSKQNTVLNLSRLADDHYEIASIKSRVHKKLSSKKKTSLK